MEPNNITPGTHPDANQLGAAGGDGAVGGQNHQEPVFTLSELKTALGKDFKDKDTALKSLKDTQSYVGRVGQLEKDLEASKGRPSAPVATGEINDIRNELASIKNETFFANNPQYKSARPLIEKLARAEGKPIHEVVGLPEMKEVFEKIQGFEKNQSLKTVLESNPRLASMQDKMSKAQELAATRSRKALTEAGETAIAAVMDAYPDLAS